MARSLAVLTFALGLSAWAQEARPSTGAGVVEHSDAPPAAGKTETSIVLASTTRLESKPSALPASAPAQPGDHAGSATAPNAAGAAPADDCLVDLLFEDGELAYRRYSGQSRASGNGAWVETPHVARAVRCGHRYLLLVKSQSKAPWQVKEARLEGSGGRVLVFHGVRSGTRKVWDINIIIAEAPDDAGSDYTLTRIDLVGRDGRTAALEEVVLP